MTKILYIPNGEYLRFFNGNGWEATIVNLEDLQDIFDDQGLQEFTIKGVMEYLNDTADVCSEWYKENELENNHVFLETELEMIYD
jgi:hypothetical protein